MKIQTATSNILETKAAAVVTGIYADGSLTPAARQVDEAAGGLLKRLFEAGDLSGEPNEVTVLPGLSQLAAARLAIVGLGPAGAAPTQGLAYQAAAAAARALSGKPRESAAWFFPADWPEDVQAAAVAGAQVGCQGQDLYRTEKSRHPFAELLWAGSEAAVQQGQILGEAVNLTRRLVNEPPQEIYPASFAELAEKIGGECGMEVEVWDQTRLESERCGSLLGVSKGSERPARLVIMKYQGGKSGAAPLAIVGKGVTFDSGGLSIKPAEAMTTMKCDMAGAATMLGAMQAIAKLKLKANVIGLAGLVENMTGGGAMKVGDVLRARSGKTIEVLNTDAEGRLVLADVLNVAIERGAGKIVDLATLTGACVVALGNDVAGAMTNDQAWCDSVLDAARTCGERLWQLPMFDEYRRLIRSEVADIKNIGEGRWGGAITAAKFLQEFVEDKPWVHLDIAGPAFLDKPRAWIDAGGSGIFVRTLVQLARQHGA